MATNVSLYALNFYNSSIYSTEYFSKACDGNAGTMWHSTDTANSWGALDLGENCWAKVTSVSIKPRSYSGAGCKDFSIYGSNDATNGTTGNWTLLTTGTHGDNENFETFMFTNTTAYRWHKIIVNTSYRSNFAMIYEIQFLAEEYNLISYIPSVGLTSANTPSPYVASGSDNDSHQAPWMAFDVSNANFYYCDSGQDINYLMLDVGEETTIISYRYKQSIGGLGVNMASQFTLKGSHDGITWTTIDTRTGLSTARDIWQHFSLSSPATYRYFKWDNIYARGRQDTCLGSFQLIKPATSPQTPTKRRFAQII